MPGKVDLLFVLDRSGSIGLSNFKQAILFIKALLKYFSISAGTTRVALISYSTHVMTDFQFNSYQNRECVYTALDKVKYNGGWTATGPALQRAIQVFNSPSSGSRKNARKVLFLLTDGKSNKGVNPKIPASVLKNTMGVDIFVLGISYSVNQVEVVSIASSTSFVFRVKTYSDLTQITRYLETGSYIFCSGHGTRYDECGRRCRCVNGQLVNCCRVRKEFTSMSHTERERYIKAVKTISTVLPYKTIYTQLIQKHRTLFFTAIHQRDEFLPWHRWFILEYENLLRMVDCRITVPYWDWSIWAHNPWGPHLWHPSTRGMGGNGVPGSGQCVQTGPFRQGVWQLTNNQCLRRNFNGIPPDAAAIQYCLSLTVFEDFENYLHIPLHDNVHCLIDGTMCTIDSAEAPEFFLHHGFIDKIWADWQKKSTANKYAYFPSINRKMQGTPYYPKDFVDILKQPGCVRVCYDEPTVNNAPRVKAFLRGLSRSKLSQLHRLPFSGINKKSLKLFRTPAKAAARAQQLAREATRGVTRSVRSRLTGFERVIGFKLAISKTSLRTAVHRLSRA